MTSERHGILLLGDTLNVGGTEGQFVEIASRISRARWDVHVSCLRAEGPLAARLERAGIAASSCGPGSLRSPRFAAAVWHLARNLRQKRIRIIHCFDFYSNALGIPAGRLARVDAVIASQRDLGNLRPRWQQWIQRRLFRIADRIVVNSPAVEDSIVSISPGLRRRIEVIANGVDDARFSPGESRSKDAEAPVFGMLTNLRPEKGVDRFLHAAVIVSAQFPRARFEIWGDGPLRPSLEQIRHELGLANTVRFHGGTADAASALRLLDVFVLASTSEASSNSLIEAMATALPVVATRVGGSVNLVEHEATGLFAEPDDVSSLASAMLRLARDRDLAARLGSAARARAMERFGFARMIGSLESVYERALGRRR